MAITFNIDHTPHFDITKSVKRDLYGDDKFIVIRDNAILLRIIENDNSYIVMTPTARDDKGGYNLYQDAELLMDIAKTAAKDCNLNQVTRKDYAKRDYIEIEACEYISDAYRYAERFVKILLGKGHYRSAENDMEDLYHDLCVDDGEPVYISDGMWLYPDGSMGER